MSTSKDLIDIINQTKEPRSENYDTQAEVVRVDGNTAWVHIPSGVDETPVQLTINAKEGDIVNVRIADGRAWITGNGSAPPTDDAVANVANGTAKSAYALSTKAKESAEEAEGMAISASRTAQEAKRVADTTDQYFWHVESAYALTTDQSVDTEKTYYQKVGDDYVVVIPEGNENPSSEGWYEQTATNTGAHITEVPKDDFLQDPENGGPNLLARSNGLAVRDGVDELAIFTLDSVQIGRQGKALAIMRPASFSVKSKDSYQPFFIVEDLRGESGVATLRETFWLADGGTSVTVNYAIEEVVEVTVMGMVVSGYTVRGRTITLASAVVGASQVIVKYRTSANIQSLTFGSRISQSIQGATSVSFGENNRAEGRNSFTAGSNLRTNASSQVAVGHLNEVEEDAVFMVGAGSGTDLPANALVVKTDGTVRIGYERMGSYYGGLEVLGEVKVGDENSQVRADLSVWGSADIDGNVSVGGSYGSGGGDITAMGEITASGDISTEGNLTIGSMGTGGEVTSFGNLKIADTGKGLRLTDSLYNEYGGIVDNGKNLWIGADKTATNHHLGGTYISAGHDGSAGNETIYVSVPNANNNNATNYPVYHGGYKPIKTVRQVYNNVAITTRSGSGAYYTNNLSVPSSIPTSATILSVTVSGFSGAAASFVPSINGRTLMLISDISQTVTQAGLLFAYQV